MTRLPAHRPSGAGDPRVEVDCRPAELPEDDLLVGGPCSCLPRGIDDWPACASCGLRQKPGKAFCSFCGSRWVTEDADPGLGQERAPESPVR